jgi:precorrin-6A/cobalt-precorrin-6A reductase
MKTATLRVLLLGGTNEATALARELTQRPWVSVLSSLAGRIARPYLPPGDVRIGGFGGPDGLAVLLREEAINAVVDATHPFAAQMSAHAALACARTHVPLLTLVRPAWQRVPGDNWLDASDIDAAAQLAVSLGTRIFSTIGRQHVAVLAPYDDRWFLIRTVDRPPPPLPKQYELLLARGPFTIDGELDLLRRKSIDAVLSKNSGGDATYAKLAAARELGIPVVLVRRPPHSGGRTVESIPAAIAWIEQLR